MLGRDAVETRHEFVDPRVVLHGAGTEWVHAQVDRVVPRRESREVADDFDLADFGEVFYTVGSVVRTQRFRGICGWDVERRQFERAFAGRGLFEDESFVLVRV